MNFHLSLSLLVLEILHFATGHGETFQLTGKPDPLSNCSISNQTFDMLQVVCQEGFDGGLDQSFIAEIYNHGHKNMFSSSVNSK